MWVGLDLVDFARPLVSARCHVSTWSSSSLLTRSSLSTACHCHCHCHCICHHQCLFCVLGVIFKSNDHLGHYVPIVAKSCFDHIFKMQLEYPYFVNATHIKFLFCTTFLIVALNLLTIKSVATLVFRHSSVKLTFKEKKSSMDDNMLVK